MSEQKVCPACGTEYPLSERFCPRDGTALRSASAQADLAGSIVAERYHVLRKLGEGGMGTVYLAEHVKMGRKVALKVMNPGMSAAPDAIARFNREAANASRLNHPNVCSIYDFGETPDGLIYLAMEFIEGESLTRVIEKNGCLSAPRTASIIHQAADALAVAHDQGIVHRDLKPDNIMIAKSRDGGDVVKVVDFGIAIASSSDAQKVTKTGHVVGTPAYMSPEQLSGDKLDGRSDIYSLGLVAFNCLTGRLPFPSESAQETMIMRLTDRPKTLAETMPDVAWPPELESVMDRALARELSRRYQKSADFGRDIAKAVASMPASVAAGSATAIIDATTQGVVPRTRVEVQSGATVQLETPAAATAVVPATAARNGPMMAAIAAVVLIGAIGGTLLFMNRNPAPRVPPGGANAITPTGADSSAFHAEKKVATDPAVSRRSGGTSAPGPGLHDTQKIAPAGAATPGAGSPLASETMTAAVARWDELINKGTPTTADAVHAIDALTPLIPKLSGRDRSNAIYVRMLAYGMTGNDEELCKAVREVIAGDSVKIHVKIAQVSDSARQCK